MLRPMRIGFVGLGVMGEPMCRNLVAASDDPVVVHDLRADPVERMVADGAVAAPSVADVVEQSDLVLLSLPGGAQLEQVMSGPDGVLATLERVGAARIGPARVADRAGAERAGVDARRIVDHTTAPFPLTRDLAARCRALGVGYCDAPIARTRQAAIDGTLSIMVGGTAEDFEAITPVLRHMATDITHCGGPGAGQITKLLNNMMLFQNVRAVAEAHAIATGLDDQHGADLGLDLDTVFGVIADASGGSFALRNHGFKSVLADNYPMQAFSTEYAMKDLSYALELAAEVGVDAVGAETVAELLEATKDAGHADQYFPVLRRML